MNLLTIILIILFAYIGIVLLAARKHKEKSDKFVLRILLNTIYWIVVFVLPIIILGPVGVYYFIWGGKIYILFYLLVAGVVFIPFRRRFASSAPYNKK